MHVLTSLAPTCLQDSFVANHLKTGHTGVLNVHSMLVCMNAEGVLVPVTMRISKISGIGEDSIFMGIFEVSSRVLVSVLRAPAPWSVQRAGGGVR